MKRSILVFAVIVVVSSLAAASFLGLIDANTRNAQLNSRLTAMQEGYDELQIKYYALLSNFSSLGYNYQNMLLQNPIPIPNPGSGAPDTQQMLARYQALQQLYLELQAQYNYYVSNYQQLKGMTDLRLMQTNLTPLVVPDDPEVIKLVQDITGKVGNVTDPNSYWKDIKAMYDWVATNIEYRDDSLYPELPEVPAEAVPNRLEHTDQMAQFANETLRLRMGDCEDISILLTAMIRAYFSKQFLVENIWITGENAGHVAVVIPFTGDDIVILDPPRSYYSHDTLGNIALNSISSEIYNWMNIWRPSLGNDVHVYRIFSDYMDKTFNGTEEYINWMYNNRQP